MTLTCGYCSSTCKKSESFVCAICNNCQHYNCIIQQTPTMAQAMKDNISKVKAGISFGCKKCAEKSFMNPLTSKFDTLEKQIQNLTDYIKEGIASQLSEMKNELSESLHRNKKFEEDTTAKINLLERDNNYLRKQINRPDIIVTGLKNNLKTDELYAAAIAIGKACDVPLTEFDINFCTYIKQKTAILIKMNNVLKRDKIMKNYRDTYTLKLNQVMETDIESRIFLNDHHIPIVAKLHYLCRKKKRTGEIESYKINNYDPFTVKLTYKNNKEVKMTGLEFLNSGSSQQNSMVDTNRQDNSDEPSGNVGSTQQNIDNA